MRKGGVARKGVVLVCFYKGRVTYYNGKGPIISSMLNGGFEIWKEKIFFSLV